MDLSSKKAGRGVYICSNLDCLAKAKKIGALSRSLECEIPDEVYERLKKELEQSE